MIPPTPWVRSFCPLSLLYPSVSDFQFRYTPVTVGKGRAAWFSLRSASVLSFGRGDKAAESGDVDYEYHHIIKGLYATCLSWHIDPCRLFIPIQHWQGRQGCGICFLQQQWFHTTLSTQKDSIKRHVGDILLLTIRQHRITYGRYVRVLLKIVMQ